MQKEEPEDKSSFSCVWDLEFGAHFMLEASQEGKLTKAAQLIADDISKRNNEYMRREELKQKYSMDKESKEVRLRKALQKVAKHQNRPHPVSQNVRLKDGTRFFVSGKDEEELDYNIRQILGETDENKL